MHIQKQSPSLVCPLCTLISMLRHSLHYLELAASQEEGPLPRLLVYILHAISVIGNFHSYYIRVDLHLFWR